MSFVNAIFLLASIAVAGPIIAHLLAKPRYRRVRFTMLHFLEEGQRQSRSRQNIRDLLILLLRCLIIVLIAILFARPALLVEAKSKQVRDRFFLALDNSASMSYSPNGTSLLDKLIDSTSEYINSVDENALFNICELATGNWKNNLPKAQALTMVSGIRSAPGTPDIDAFLSTVDSAARRTSGKGIVSALLVSDFTPNVLRRFENITEPVIIDNVDHKIIGTDGPIDNAALIDAVCGEIENGKMTLYATVINYAPTERTRRLIARAGVTKSRPVNVKLAAHQRRIYPVKIDIDAELNKQTFLPVELTLADGDPLKVDDTFYLGVSIPAHKYVNVLFVDDGNGRTFLLKTAAEALFQKTAYTSANIRTTTFDRLRAGDLGWADTIVLANTADRLTKMTTELRRSVLTGKRVIFFVAEQAAHDRWRKLWTEGILAALPGECARQRVYIKPSPEQDDDLAFDTDAAKSLTNCRVDRVLLTGFSKCEPHPAAVCTWRLQNGEGFVFLRRIGEGSSILVNTSCDDSLGTLTKSSSALAFCRYLLGRRNDIAEFSFTCDQQVLLPPAEAAHDTNVWVEICDGSKRQGNSTGSAIVVPNAGGIGWVRTLNMPQRYAGVNLPADETDMARPSRQEIQELMARAFTVRENASPVEAGIAPDKKHKPIWKLVAALIIVLLIAESAVANRLKR